MKSEFHFSKQSERILDTFKILIKNKIASSKVELANALKMFPQNMTDFYKRKRNLPERAISSLCKHSFSGLYVNRNYILHANGERFVTANKKPIKEANYKSFSTVSNHHRAGLNITDFDSPKTNKIGSSELQQINEKFDLLFSIVKKHTVLLQEFEQAKKAEQVREEYKQTLRQLEEKKLNS